jgi:hypothetical protein
MTDRREWLKRRIALALMGIVSGAHHALPAQPVSFSSSNLPILVIDTQGQRIRDNVRITASLGIVDNAGKRNSLSDPFTDGSGEIAIETRGSATQSYPKGQYRFETQDEAGENRNVRLLGMPSENDWILYGPYDDQSLIRNNLAYGLSMDLGRYASRCRFCELVLNGDYRGVYVLMEKIKRDRSRVDIAAMDWNDNAWDSLTGGYILKIDKWEGENMGGWRSSRNTAYQYHYPAADDITEAQKQYIRDWMDEFEGTLDGDSTGDLREGYENRIDTDSFVDHFLLNEFCKNVDAYRISAFLYKDRDSSDPRLHAGPVWDFNLSFGKTWWIEDRYQVEGWQIDYGVTHPWDGYQVPFWWITLARDGSFVRRVQARWNSLKHTLFSKDSLFSRIHSMTGLLGEARTRNFERWPETAAEHGYDEEIALLKQWISDRWDWIDVNIGSLSPENESSSPGDFSLGRSYPNPFNERVTIPFSLKKKAHFRLSVCSALGREIRLLFGGDLSPGEHRFAWDGKDGGGKNTASGVYWYRAEVAGRRSAGKMLLLR